MLEGLKNVKKEIWTRRKLTTIIGLGTLLWVLFVLLYFPAYSKQMIFSSITYFDNAFLSLLSYQYATSGLTGVSIPLIIAFSLAVSAVYTVSTITSGFDGNSIFANFSGGIGFFSAGCASCSVGLLPLLGFSAGVAALPFNGRGLQLLSIALILGSLEYSGRQTNSTCEVSTEKQIL